MSDSIADIQTENSKPEILYFEKIDVIRFFAALMVVVFHTYQSWKNHWGYPEIILEGTNLTTFGQLLHSFLMNGDFGVDLFFIISGFLITFLLLKEKENNNGKIDFRKFYIRRGLRIWPLYFLIILISPLLVNWLGQSRNPNYMSHIFFYSNFDSIGNTDNWIFPLSHFWSLCVEEHFYILWPFVIGFIPNKHLVKVFMFLIVLSVCYRAYVYLVNTNSWYHIYLSTFSRFDTLVIGSLTALAYFKKRIEFRINWLIRLLIYALLLFLFGFFNAMQWDSVMSVCFKKYIYIGIALIIILDFLFNDNGFFRLMNNQVFRYLGKVSYGIYVYGLLVFEIIIQKIMDPNGIKNIYLYWFLVVSFSIIIPIISYELFEKKILKVKKRFEVVRLKEGF